MDFLPTLFSDVLAGFALGLFWLTITFNLAGRIKWH